MQRVAYSPWLEYNAATFETTGVADIVQAMILTEDQSFLDLLRVIGRVYRTLDILQTDKLRINDRGSLVTPDVTLQRDHIAADAGVTYTRQEETSVPRELELLTIDPGRRLCVHAVEGIASAHAGPGDGIGSAGTRSRCRW